MANQDNNVTVEVNIDAFGNSDNIQEQVLLSVARAVHNMSFRRFTIRIAGTSEWFTYDPLGDDMGHHTGHDAPLLPKERT